VAIWKLPFGCLSLCLWSGCAYGLRGIGMCVGECVGGRRERNRALLNECTARATVTKG
jgi:hypothetical protein